MDRRLADPHRLRIGMLCLVGIAVLYAVTLLLLAIGGDKPGPAPWLDIPRSSYFYWEAAFATPVFIAAGVLAAASMQLLARAWGGTGSFEDTMALTGFAVAICTLFSVIPDLIEAVLMISGILPAKTFLDGVAHPTPILALVWAYLIAYLLAFLVLFPAVVSTVHRLPGARAVAVGVAGFAVYQGFVYVFIR